MRHTTIGFVAESGVWSEELGPFTPTLTELILQGALRRGPRRAPALDLPASAFIRDGSVGASHTTATQIADRLGVSTRHVVRARRAIREGQS